MPTAPAAPDLQQKLDIKREDIGGKPKQQDSLDGISGIDDVKDELKQKQDDWKQKREVRDQNFGNMRQEAESLATNYQTGWHQGLSEDDWSDIKSKGFDVYDSNYDSDGSGGIDMDFEMGMYMTPGLVKNIPALTDAANLVLKHDTQGLFKDINDVFNSMGITFNLGMSESGGHSKGYAPTREDPGDPGGWESEGSQVNKEESGVTIDVDGDTVMNLPYDESMDALAETFYSNPDNFDQDQIVKIPSS